MTRLDAIKELAAKVESGTADQYNGPPWRELFGGHIQAGNVANAYYNGSLDAAKALHEAVLRAHDLPVIGRTDHAPHDWFVNIGNGDSEFNPDPARAWLLAILRALIAQEEAP